MHAVIIPARFNEGQSAARSELAGLVSQVSGMPGFVAGYWVALSEDHGTSLIVFESEDAARTFAEGIPDGPAPGGVTPGKVEVGEVVAQA